MSGFQQRWRNVYPNGSFLLRGGAAVGPRQMIVNFHCQVSTGIPPLWVAKMVQSTCSSELLLRSCLCSAHIPLNWHAAYSRRLCFAKCSRPLTGATSDSTSRSRCFTFCAVLQVSPKFIYGVIWFYIFYWRHTEVLRGSRVPRASLGEITVITGDDRELWRGFFQVWSFSKFSRCRLMTKGNLVASSLQQR